MVRGGKGAVNGRTILVAKTNGIHSRKTPDLLTAHEPLARRCSPKAAFQHLGQGDGFFRNAAFTLQPRRCTNAFSAG